MQKESQEREPSKERDLRESISRKRAEAGKKLTGRELVSLYATESRPVLFSRGKKAGWGLPSKLTP